MLKVTIILGAILVTLVAESSCQRFIQPTFRPPKQKLILRRARDVGVLTPLALEDSPVSLHEQESLDRTVRSIDSSSAKRGGGSQRTSTGSRNTGPTHPGYNRRNAREIRLPGHLNPLRPKPLFPRPSLPQPVPQRPIYARIARDIQVPALKKPTHRDLIIPNWNPHVKTNPWNNLGGRGRHGRSIDMAEEFEVLPHERVARDVQISGLPKKPTHRDVIIPNWNPHVKTNPWNSLGGRGRHGRSIDITEEFEVLPHERVARDVQISGLPKKPNHRDVIIPNWNPHVKTNPWNCLGGRGRHH